MTCVPQTDQFPPSPFCSTEVPHSSSRCQYRSARSSLMSTPIRSRLKRACSGMKGSSPRQLVVVEILRRYELIGAVQFVCCAAFVQTCCLALPRNQGVKEPLLVFLKTEERLKHRFFFELHNITLSYCCGTLPLLTGVLHHLSEIPSWGGGGGWGRGCTNFLFFIAPCVFFLLFPKPQFNILVLFQPYDICL